VGKKKLHPPTWLHGPLSVAVRSLIAAPLVAGLTPSLAAARALARTYASLPANRKRLDRALSHLRIAFPEWDADRRRQTAVASYEHLFQVAVEIAYAPRLLSADGWCRHVRLGHVEAALPPMLASRPTLLITAHCGNWELMGYTLAVIGFPVHAVYRPLDLAPLDAWVRRTRESHGIRLISKFGAIWRVDRVVARGEPLAFVADQNGGDRGVFAPFFGRLASTYKSIGLLAMQHGATIVCGTSRRLEPGEAPPAGVTTGSEVPGGLRRWHADPPHAWRAPGGDAGLSYVAEISDMFGPEDWASQPDPLFYLTARYRRAFETMVRRAPRQYLWMHRSWKSRPPHERTDRPFPAALRDKLRSLPWMTDAELEAIVDRSDRDRAEIAAGRTLS